MHKVIVIQFVTLDGVVEDKFRLGEVLNTGVKLVGRTTWELFSRSFLTEATTSHAG